MAEEQIEFKVGERVVSPDTNEKGAISRLCADKDIIFVRWDRCKMQEMVKTSSLKREVGNG